jgi:chaperonin GroES
VSPTSPKPDRARGTDSVVPTPLPIKMLHDRLLIRIDGEAAERHSAAGLLIPATVAVGKRMAWATVVAVGEHVRQVAVGDRVLYDPEQTAEAEVHGVDYLLLRERDIHAVAQPEGTAEGTGLYL